MAPAQLTQADSIFGSRYLARHKEAPLELALLDPDH